MSAASLRVASMRCIISVISARARDLDEEVVSAIFATQVLQ